MDVKYQKCRSHRLLVSRKYIFISFHFISLSLSLSLYLFLSFSLSTNLSLSPSLPHFLPGLNSFFHSMIYLLSSMYEILLISAAPLQLFNRLFLFPSLQIDLRVYLSFIYFTKYTWRPRDWKLDIDVLNSESQ